ncbi:hydroxyacylglutathione hydrolase [Tolumonas lignilytica]|jgi:hydroxyacylglutathione hydrolase|uniref:hydroxyacylglutathione hydrolase n=1 Tax=Tolumonas lignilytica TaxID=1283284 RepID=UPI000463E065|nr:hydroxyacylglutathione hydrolase [Tolumonas lignilytica]
MLQVQTIPSRQDNYIWLITKGNQAIVVDPGEASPVVERLQQQNLNLKAIFITHHHHDHTEGVAELITRYPHCEVYGPQILIPGVSHFQVMRDQDLITFPDLDLRFTVWHTPGHTAEHIVFHGHGALFCGDTLFSGGCGRLFTGTAEQMFNSLQRLASLPEETLVYAAHEYTYNNLSYCLRVEPDNIFTINRIKEVSKLRQQGCSTLPSTIAIEKQSNVFLRTQMPAVINFVQNLSDLYLENEIQIFAILREKKNNL